MANKYGFASINQQLNVSSTPDSDLKNQVELLTQNIISVLLIVLFYLNIYWFVLLLMMGYRLAFKHSAEDLQNVIKISKENKVE